LSCSSVASDAEFAQQSVSSSGAASATTPSTSTSVELHQSMVLLNSSTSSLDAPQATGNSTGHATAGTGTGTELPPTTVSNEPTFLFFNAGASTRKVLASLPITMAALQSAFAREMQLELASLPPLYIRDQFTSIEYELKAADDVYPTAFITIRVTSPQHYKDVAPSSVASSSSSSQQQQLQHHAAGTRASSYLLESMVLRRQKLVIVLVGKPGNGKTFVAQKLARYLNWNGVLTKVFSIGEHRRAKLGFRDASFYDPSDAAAVESRQTMALETLDELLAFLIATCSNNNNNSSSSSSNSNNNTQERQATGMAAILDGNNVSEARRSAILTRLKNGGVTPSEVLFLEITKPPGAPVVPDVRETELDYSAVLAPDEARKDLSRRMSFYAAAYEALPMERAPPLATRERPMMVRVCPEEHLLSMRDVRSYVAQRIVSLLMNVGTRKKKMWFSRHGESMYNLTGQLGGNSDLSDKGHQYAKALAQWFQENVDQQTRERMIVVTSTLQRTISTSRHFTCEKLALPALDEIDAGICDGMTYDGIAREYPAEAAARAADKFHYRYPRGESYVDVVQRLEPVLLELERVERPVLVISHQAIMRVLVSYFRDVPPEKIPHMDMPLHTLVEITPSVGSLHMKEHKLI
jgi:broad specificity phosphatase PhoE